MARDDMETSSRSGSLARTLVIGGSLLLIGAGIRSWLKAGARPPVATDRLRDKTLKDSFPASDPPASQYFDIPSNRQS